MGRLHRGKLFRFISSTARMLNYLGMRTKAEFVADNEGCVSNPYASRGSGYMVERAVMEQLAEGC